MDEIKSDSGGNVKDQVDGNNTQQLLTARTTMVDGQSSDGSQPHGGSNQAHTVSSEHPEGPDFDPDFGKMNQEFREKIRSRQHEEWD